MWTGLKEGAIGDMKRNDMIYLGAVPMFHAYGLVTLLPNGISSGGSIVLVPNPRDVDEIVDIIHHYKTNVFLGILALYNAVNNHSRVQRGEVSLRSFLLSISGSAPLPNVTQKQYESLSQCPIVEGFGMSETPIETH